MAYATGSTIGMQSCFDKIVETVTAAGWTLIDDLSATDKVFKSNGEDNLSHHIMRLTIDDKVTHTAPTHYQNAYPHIVFRGYHAWDTATHTGINEFGEFGPYIYSGPGGTQGRMEIGLPNAPNTLADRYADVSEPYEVGGYTGTGVYLGERSLLSAGMLSNDILKEWDLITGEYRNLPEPPVNGEFPPDGAYAVVWDKVTDETYLFALHSNSNAENDHFWRYSFNSNSWERRAAPPWPTTKAAGAFVVWDGRDTIYAGPGANTTHFAKYSISTNTWTALPALPVARSDDFGQILSSSYSSNQTFNCHQVYLPKESTGLASDYIFMYLSISNVIYSYEVDTGTWGTRNLTHPYGATAAANRTALVFDGKRGLWAIAHQFSTTAYKWDTTNLAAAPVAVTNFFRGTNPANGAALVDPYVARVRCHATEPYTYWIFANKNRVIVVTDVKGHQRWAYFGGMQSYYKNSMRITSAATAGLGVTVFVNDTTNYSAGDSILLVDTATGAIEKTPIISIVGPTSFTANLRNNYTVGSLVGTDPLTTIAAGSTCLAVAAMDADGYTVGRSASYKIAPLMTPAAMMRSLPSKRDNVYQPWPLILFNTVTKWPTYENRGSLDGVYAVQSGAYPAPQPLDEVSIDGKTYICFDMQETRNIADKFRVVIGPRE